MKKFSSLKQRKRQTSGTNLVHVRHVQHRDLSSGAVARTTQKRFRSSESMAQSSNSAEEEEEETLGTSILSNETLASERLRSQESGTDMSRRAKGSTLKSSHGPSDSSLTLSLPKEIRTSWLDNERSLDIDALGQAQQLLSKPPAENRTTAKSIFSTNKSVILDPHRCSISGRPSDAPEQAMAGYFMARPPDYPPEVFTETSEYDDVHQYQSVDGSFNSHSDREFRSVSSKFTAPGTQASDVELDGGPATRIDSDVSVGTKPFAVLSQLDVAAVTEKPSVIGGTASSWKPAAAVSGRAADAVPGSSSMESNKYWSADFLPSNFGPSGVTERGSSKSDLTATVTNSYSNLDRPFAAASAVNFFDGQQIVRAPSSLDSAASSATLDQNKGACLQNIPGKMADLYQAFAASGRELENVTSTSSTSFPVLTEVTVIQSRTYVCSEEISRTISRELCPGVGQAQAAPSVAAAVENVPSLPCTVRSHGQVSNPSLAVQEDKTNATGQFSPVRPLEWKQEPLGPPEIEFLTQDTSAQRHVKNPAVGSTQVGTKPPGVRDVKQLDKAAESGTRGKVSKSKIEALTHAPEPLDSSAASGVDLVQRSQKQLPSSKSKEDTPAASVRKKGERHRKRHTPTASGGVTPKSLVEARTEHIVNRRSPGGAYSSRAAVPTQHVTGPPEWRPIASVTQPGLAPIEEKLERSTTSFSITEATAPTHKEPLPSPSTTPYSTLAAETRPAICHDTTGDRAPTSLESEPSQTELGTSNALDEGRLIERTPSVVMNFNSATSLVPGMFDDGIEHLTRDETTGADFEFGITNNLGKKPSTGSLKTIATISICHTAGELEQPNTNLEKLECPSFAAPLKSRGSRESVTSIKVTVSSSANISPNFVKRPSAESLKSLPGIPTHENAELLQKPSTATEKSESREELVSSLPCADVSSATVSVADSLDHLRQLELLDQASQEDEHEALEMQVILSPENEVVLLPDARDLGVAELMVYSGPPTPISPGTFTDETISSFRWDRGVPQQGIVNDQAEQEAEREKSRYPDRTAAAAQGHPGDERIKPSPSSPAATRVKEPGFLCEEPLRRPVVSSSWAETSIQEEERRRSSSSAGTPRAPLTVPAALAEEHSTHLSHEQRRRSSAPSSSRGSTAGSGIPPEEGAFAPGAISRRCTNTGEPTFRERQRVPGRLGSSTPDRCGVPGGKKFDFDHHGDASLKSEEAMTAATTALVDRRSIGAEGTLLEETDQRPCSDVSERSTSEPRIVVSDSRGFQPVTSEAVFSPLTGNIAGGSEQPELTHRGEDIRPAVQMLAAEEPGSACEADRTTNLYQGGSALRQACEARERSIDFEQSCGEKSSALDDHTFTTFVPLSSAEVVERFSPELRRPPSESLDDFTERTNLFYATLFASAGRPLEEDLAVNQTSPLLEPPFSDNADLPAEQTVTRAWTRDLVEWYEDEDDGVDGSTISLDESQQHVEEVRLLAEAASRRRLLPPLVNMFPFVEEQARLYRSPTVMPPPLHLLTTASVLSTDAKPKKKASRRAARTEAIDDMARVVALSFAFVAFVAAASILLTRPTEHARP